MDFKRCSTSTRNKVISVKEEKSTFRINNKSKIIISKVTVDGCLINDHRERCDYLFEINDPFTSVVYVELKNGETKKASKQLGATIGYCKNRHKHFPRSCYIVASRVPRSGPSVQELKIQFAKTYGILLKISTICEEISV